MSFFALAQESRQKVQGERSVGPDEGKQRLVLVSILISHSLIWEANVLEKTQVTFGHCTEGAEVKQL